MNNPPAFPNDVEQISERAGMTLRDYFAAKAMQGLMHNYHPCDFLEHKGWLEDISMASYQMADAMLKAREQGEDYRAMYLKVRDELAELQQRTWVGLTDEEMRECNINGDFMCDRETAKLNVQARLKEKNA